MTNSENKSRVASSKDNEFGRFLVWNSDGGFARQEFEPVLHLRASAQVDTENAASHG